MIDIKKTIEDSVEVKHLMLNDCLNEIESAVDIMIDAAKQGNKILWCGNGGSAADAQHMAAELMGGLRTHDRPAIASLALTTDSSFITAWSNDADYESIFSRQIEALGNEGDILVGISTSGNSNNVINAINAAKIKLKNKAKSESSVPRKEPKTSPSFISPKPRASFLKAQVPTAPMINNDPPNASMP